MEWKIKVGISKSFRSDYLSLHPEKQKDTRKALCSFMHDWDTTGLDYEQVQGTTWLWSIRTSGGDRAFLKPYEAEGVYLFLTVGHHDNARERAKRKQVDVNPYTGAIQIFEMPEDIMAAPASKTDGALSDEAPSQTVERPFAGVSNEDLLKIGVPGELLEYVHRMDMEWLGGAESRLPQGAYECLALLAEGEPLDDVLDYAKDYYAKSQRDIVAALESPASRETFFVVDNEDELEKALSGSWEDWMIFLHPKQRRIVDADFKGPARVIGAAGTGKTVAALHRAKRLASECGPGEKVFFTTFTTNLTEDISRNLEKICTPEELERIEVRNMDDWADAFLKKYGLRSGIVYNRPRIRALDNMWKEASQGSPLGFDVEVYKNEWETVVMPQRILSYEEYAKADRKHSGLRLDAVQRKQM